MTLFSTNQFFLYWRLGITDMSRLCLTACIRSLYSHTFKLYINKVNDIHNAWNSLLHALSREKKQLKAKKLNLWHSKSQQCMHRSNCWSRAIVLFAFVIDNWTRSLCTSGGLLCCHQNKDIVWSCKTFTLQSRPLFPLFLFCSPQ